MRYETGRAALSPAPILQASDLVLVAKATGAVLVDGVDLSRRAGEVHALVGESGSGKSLTALALLDLLPPGIERQSGRILLNGEEITGPSARALRGRAVAAIFQDPQASLDPRWTVGRYLIDRFMRLRGMGRRVASDAAAEMLGRVGLANSSRLLKSYPHELSGGMAQRVMIAGALAGEPHVLLADEPTTALDVTTQAQILELLEDIRSRTGLAILMITHDLGVVAEIAHRVTVLYGGQVMERGMAAAVLERPRNPYTRALLAAMPDITSDKPPAPIPPAQGDCASKGCSFASRCPRALPVCGQTRPVMIRSPDGGSNACHLTRAIVAPVVERALHAAD